MYPNSVPGVSGQAPLGVGIGRHLYLQVAEGLFQAEDLAGSRGPLYML